MSPIKTIGLFIISLLVAFTCIRGEDNAQSGINWEKYECAPLYNHKIAEFYLLTLDPREYEFALLSISEQQTAPKTASEWCDTYGYEICFNAGMFRRDNNGSLGYCKNYNHVINPRLNRHNSILAFNPKNHGDLPLRIIDRRCEDFDSISGYYNTLIQNMRMLGCGGGNVWNQSDERHSILALGTDNRGNLLLFFAREPLSGHDLINLILEKNPDIGKLMYLEGGAHASLYINTDSLEINMSGLLEGLISMRNIDIDLPRVIAIRKKPDAPPKSD